jgi:hypothetical protein
VGGHLLAALLAGEQLGWHAVGRPMYCVSACWKASDSLRAGRPVTHSVTSACSLRALWIADQTLRQSPMQIVYKQHLDRAPGVSGACYV